ncbi:MAG: prepilin-type N-terminal cleavage/methylation domain-containing protein, partial [Planctomycetota bacterium]|nr:prepilin-type N-terminal cleavage/methylation domain-containing protein [Planctomycetota bacterium]
RDVAFPRKRRAAFTLTEMLMAAGILGIGLTMVASIFPVAVDQSRRSRDQTMAALCARSAMARVRADRNAIINWLRDNTDSSYAFIDLNYLAGGYFDVAGRLHVVYRPSVFLYTSPTKPTSRTYEGGNTWDAGNYVARIFATRSRSPLSATAATDGPYRLTIVVCRSIGKLPSTSATSELWANATNPKPGPGTYILEPSGGLGWGYLIDYVTIDTSGGTPKITGYPAVGVTSGGYIISPTTTTIRRVPDAVAVYHTMLGE